MCYASFLICQSYNANAAGIKTVKDNLDTRLARG